MDLRIAIEGDYGSMEGITYVLRSYGRKILSLWGGCANYQVWQIHLALSERHRPGNPQYQTVRCQPSDTINPFETFKPFRETI